MSEKRFKVDYDNCSGGRIMDRKDKYGQYCRLYDFGEVGRQQIVDLLNSLNDENEELRRRLEKINGGYGLLTHRNGKTANEWLIKQLESENEQLRQELNDCEKFRHSVFKRMNELTDQLKEKEEDEKLYAEEILKLREINQFNELGGDY